MKTLVKFKYITFYNSILNTLLFVRLKNTRFSKILLFSISLYNCLSELKRVRTMLLSLNYRHRHKKHKKQKRSYLRTYSFIRKRLNTTFLKIRLKANIKKHRTILKNKIINLSSSNFFYRYKSLIVEKICKPFFIKHFKRKKKSISKMSVYTIFYLLSRITKYKCKYRSNPNNYYFSWQISMFLKMSYNITLYDFRFFYKEFKKKYNVANNDINSFFILLENKIDIFLFRFCMLSKKELVNYYNSSLLHINGEYLHDSNTIVNRGDIIEFSKSENIIKSVSDKKWFLFFFNIYTLNNIYFRKVLFPIKYIILDFILTNIRYYNNVFRYVLVRYLYYPILTDISKIERYKTSNILRLNLFFSNWNFNLDCFNGSITFSNYYYDFHTINHNTSEEINLYHLLHNSSFFKYKLHHLSTLQKISNLCSCSGLYLLKKKYAISSNLRYNLFKLLKIKKLFFYYLIRFKSKYTVITTLILRVINSNIFRHYFIRFNGLFLRLLKPSIYYAKLLLVSNKHFFKHKELFSFYSVIKKQLSDNISYFYLFNIYSIISSLSSNQSISIFDNLKSYSECSVVFNYKGLIWSFFLSSLTIMSNDFGCLYWNTDSTTCVLVYGFIDSNKHIRNTLFLNKSFSINSLSNSFRYDFNL